MKISYKWLGQYIEQLPAPEELSVMLTDCGLEVEGMENVCSIPGGLRGVVTGQVVSCGKHPNADKLSVTTVSIGNDTLLPIVCGAPNVAAGQKVLVATVGTRVTTAKGSFIIEKAKIRGEVSEGMICAEDELGLGTSHDGIMILPEDTAVGMPAAEYFNIEDDVVFEIGLTPNRSDAASHMGVARDVIALQNLKAGSSRYGLKMPEAEPIESGKKNSVIGVVLEDTAACPRYSGITLSGIRVAPSPEWMQNRLKAIGLRPINNIVDITNYVLMETGQPLHAFDADKISGGKVIVKKLPAGSRFVTLDEVERTLNGEELMICDENGGMCMAGIFGGTGSGVTENTGSVFIESACFDPVTTRKASRHHGLKTDASFRFERGSDISMTLYALRRASRLIMELAGGSPVTGEIDVYPVKREKKSIVLRYEKLDQLVGKSIPKEDVKLILTSLGMEISREDEPQLVVMVRYAKVGVTREAGLIEEVLRIYGYNRIDMPEGLRSNLAVRPKPDPEFLRNAVSDELTALGFYEIMTNSLSSAVYTEKLPGYAPEQNVPVLNPISRELNVMRRTLLFSAMESLVYNLNRKNSDLMFYEYGKVYWRDGEHSVKEGLGAYHERNVLGMMLCGYDRPEQWKEERRKFDLYHLKVFVEKVMMKMGVDRSSLAIRQDDREMFETCLQFQVNTRSLAFLGKLSRKTAQYFDVKEEVFYAELDWDALFALSAAKKVVACDIPRFPEVRRDLALVIGPEISWDQIEKLAFKTGGKLLKSINLFDIYRDEKLNGRVSYAISFMLQDEEKTLTDKEIEQIMQQLLKAFEKQLGAVLR